MDAQLLVYWDRTGVFEGAVQYSRMHDLMMLIYERGTVDDSQTLFCPAACHWSVIHVKKRKNQKQHPK